MIISNIRPMPERNYLLRHAASDTSISLAFCNRQGLNMGESLSKTLHIICNHLKHQTVSMMTELTDKQGIEFHGQKTFNQLDLNLQTICLELLAGYHIFHEDNKMSCG